MMDDDLEQRLLSGRTAGDDHLKGLQRYSTDKSENLPSSGRPAFPQPRDMRKKRTNTPSIDPAPQDQPQQRLNTTTSPTGFVSPRDASPSSVPVDSSPPQQQEEQEQQQQRSTSPVESAVATVESAAGDDADEGNREGEQERNNARTNDEQALARVQLRMERLWKLEEEHAVLEQRHKRLEKAKKTVEEERLEWQTKHAQLAKDNEKMTAQLSELKREKHEMEVTVQKLNKRYDDERERYALLSSQFNELNNKMVEIINNVTNLKLDEISDDQKLSPRRQTGSSGAHPLPKMKATQPIAQSAAAYFGFSSSSSPSKPATPSKPKTATTLTPAKPRE